MATQKDDRSGAAIAGGVMTGAVTGGAAGLVVAGPVGAVVGGALGAFVRAIL